jgi:hypothetical protein
MAAGIAAAGVVASAVLLRLLPAVIKVVEAAAAVGKARLLPAVSVGVAGAAATAAVVVAGAVAPHRPVPRLTAAAATKDAINLGT